jgi:predicted GH43/DUF377 family glycosyl hydrolase
MKWKKLGQIFDPTQVNDGINRDWMKSHSQCPSAVIFDTFVRIYFSCRPNPDQDGQYVSYTTYIDLDRSNLTKVINIAQRPVMELGELGTFDEFAIYPTSVLRDGKNTLMYYAGWSRCKSIPYTVSIGLATGDEQGTQFTRYSKGPILTNSAFEPFELSGPKVRKINDKWYMYYLAGEKWQIVDGRAESLYKIRLAISDDGVTWAKLNKDLVTSILADGECQAGPDVFFKDGMYHMYFSYRHAHDYRNKDRGYRIGYAYSSDAITWTRDDSTAGIVLSDIGWDSEMQHYPHVFELDDNHYMVYNGNDFGRYGLGLAKLIK